MKERSFDAFHGEGRPWKVLFVGMGSIGKRHFRLLKQLAPVEGLRWRSGKGDLRDADELENVTTVDTLAEGIKLRPHFAVIANPTACHVEPATELAEAGIPMVIEKPVSHTMAGLDRLLRIVEEKEIPVMIGYQWRCHPSFETMLKIIRDGKIGRPLCLHAIVGQYLPDWRPDIDYAGCYSARSAMGGGVICDLSHEIDIALALMGPAKRLACLCGKFSDLDIDSEDIAVIAIEHKNRSVSGIHLDYIERGYFWQTRISCSNGTLFWDYGNGTLEIRTSEGTLKKIEDPAGFSRDEMILRQWRIWLETLAGRAEPPVGLKQGIEVTRVCCAAKESSSTGKFVAL
ncbi:MAG: Gfo/Idh/MocA family oxidoreductase [Deltaproteobacteria bacterium]|nr:Gfo/Idh/MocA family oxidoreductase [Deltaproteobacteria bacterium]